MATAAPDPNRWKALALICTAIFVVVLDVAIVNVALPSIGRDLGFAPENLQWVITAYPLTFGGFLLLGGRAADLLGRRLVFMVGLALFTVGVARLRAVAERRNADRRARGSRSRRCNRLPGGPLDHLGDLHGGRRTQQGARSMGRGRRQRRRGRRALRRHPHQVPGVGVDLLRQHPGRDRGARAGDALRSREPPGRCGARVRRGRCALGDERARPPRVRDLRGARTSAGRLSERSACWSLSGALLLFFVWWESRDARAADAARDLPQPDAHRGEHRQRPPVRRHLRLVLAADALHAAGAGPLRAADRSRVPRHCRHSGGAWPHLRRRSSRDSERSS